MKNKNGIILKTLILIMIIFVLLIILIFFTKKIENKVEYEDNYSQKNDKLEISSEERKKALNELINKEKTIYDTPQIYPEEAIIDFVNWKYGNEWILQDTLEFEKYYIRYTFSRKQNNDYFYVYSYSEQNQVAVAGSSVLEPDGTYSRKSYDFYTYDIALSHLNQINDIAKEKGLDIKVSTIDNNEQQDCNIILKINSDNQIDSVADYMIELDKILQYSIKDGTARTYLDIEVKYNDKETDLYVPQFK